METMSPAIVVWCFLGLNSFTGSSPVATILEAGSAFRRNGCANGSMNVKMKVLFLDVDGVLLPFGDTARFLRRCRDCVRARGERERVVMCVCAIVCMCMHVCACACA